MSTAQKTQELLDNMKSTAASRYNASQRLEGREKSLTRLTAFTSAYVIGLTVLPYFLRPEANVADLVNLLTVLLSVIMLVASLLQYSARDGVNAEQHYRCGLEIGELRRNAKIRLEELTQAELLVIADEYSLILQKYSVNHDPLDYDQFRFERPDEYKKLSIRDKLLFRPRIAVSRHLATIVLLLESKRPVCLLCRGVAAVR